MIRVRQGKRRRVILFHCDEAVSSTAQTLAEGRRAVLIHLPRAGRLLKRGNEMRPAENIDRAWFKRNPTHNFRIRRFVDGEMAELLHRAMPSGGYELALLGNKLPDIGDDLEWRVCVVNISPNTLLRFPTTRPKDAPGELGVYGQSGTGIAFVFANNLVLDRVRS